MNTEQKIINMLKENTGSHFLDSGGAYGRHHERNQIREFESESPVSISFKYGIEYTRNLYHFLVESLYYNQEMENIFNSHYSQCPDSMGYLEIMETFPEYLYNEHGIETYGLYGDSDPFTENTYNFDCNLSQTIQFLYFETDDSAYVLLQIHGGCDVRGGYTKPACFQVETDMFFMFSDGYIQCSNCESSWYTDDSYHWYINDSRNKNILELHDYKLMSITDYIIENNLTESETEFIFLLQNGEINRVERLEHQLNLIPDIPKPIKYQIHDNITIPDDVLLYDDHGIGLCPNCYHPLT